ncbi:MAG: iron-containing alcohol dehydrogenase [Desulfuromonadaceae bacterium]|nr:iron-containing alcohol dehydrogenase [Desulfuromonadaceae bacterium]MDD2856405.1 iron-containing alcohol dehydrogenase [Desulfuromonadaceae bacterium]
MSAYELRKFVAPEIVFGVGAIDRVGQYAALYGAKRAFVVSDPGVVAAGWTGRVLACLEEVGLQYSLFTDVSSNPRAEEVMAGAELHRLNRCDLIIAVGGGSAMDCAKGIGIVVSNSGSILDYEGIDRITLPMPPLICIPTTAGTSADVSQFTIITDRKKRSKIAIISKAVVPDVAIIDPQTLTTMSPYLTACTGMDALVHAIEAYVSNACSPLTDLHALEAIRLISANLLPSIASSDNIEHRSQMMLGSLEAGLAFSNASLGAVHAMAHSLGGYLDLPHGECNAMLLEHVVSFNYSEVGERYGNVGRALGLEVDKMGASEINKAVFGKIRELRIDSGIDGGLEARGVRVSDISDLAQNAIQDACMATNPRNAVKRDLEVIFEEAL